MKARWYCLWLVLALGCFNPPDEQLASVALPPLMAFEMDGFSWVVDEQLAGMPRPGSNSPLEQDMSFLRDQELDLLFSLTVGGTDPELAASYGVEILHLPVTDFTAPSLEQLEQFVTLTRAALAKGERVGVHCGAGLGRTGTFLAAYFVTTGLAADAAIAHVRALRPGSIETDAQEQVVRDFAAKWSN